MHPFCWQVLLIYGSSLNVNRLNMPFEFRCIAARHRCHSYHMSYPSPSCSSRSGSSNNKQSQSVSHSLNSQHHQISRQCRKGGTRTTQLSLKELNFNFLYHEKKKRKLHIMKRKKSGRNEIDYICIFCTWTVWTAALQSIRYSFMSVFIVLSI